MEELVVEWDDNKNTINRQVHHISFETAKLVFADPDRIERLDNSLADFGLGRQGVICSLY